MEDQTSHERAWEQALEEAIELFEQGQAVNEAQFLELVSELEQRQTQLRELPDEDPGAQRILDLRNRAEKLAQSAAEGTGPTAQLSSILAHMTGTE